MLKSTDRIALYMKGAVKNATGKMGWGVIRYSSNPIVCVIEPEFAGQDTASVAGMPKAIPIVATWQEAAALKPDVLVLGIAPLGGAIPQEWMEDIDAAVQSGVSVLNGLHEKLGPRYPVLRPDQYIWDVRNEPAGLVSGTGLARELNNKRVLFVGTDMAVGKMTAGLEILALAQQRGLSIGFVATGQIGITITGAGIPLDAIRVDFASGAVEVEVLKNAEKEIVLIEGQGAINHPGSTSTLPLMRGSCPTHLIMCVRANQFYVKELPDVPIPPLRDLLNLLEDIGEAAGTFARPKSIAVAANTSTIASDSEAMDWCKNTEDELGIPVSDPVRHGAERLLDAIVNA